MAYNPLSSKPAKVKPTPHRRKFDWQMVFTLLMYGFMYLPILVLAFYSFNTSPYSAQWEGFTFSWYAEFFSDGKILTALQTSLVVAIVAVGISAVLGTMMAVGLARYRFPGKFIYRGLSYLPMIIPDIAIAVATLVFLAVVAIPLSLGTVISAHIVFCLAYIAVVVSTRINGLDPHLEEAAMDLGADSVQAFLRVLLPELMPAIISGCLLSFILSMDDFLISSFTAGGGVATLPMEIFSRIRTGVKPDINALSVFLILFSGLIGAAAEYIRYQADQKRTATR